MCWPRAACSRPWRSAGSSWPTPGSVTPPWWAGAGTSTSPPWPPSRASPAPRDGSSPPTATRPIPTPEGLMPGSGALLAAVATASGVVPLIAGQAASAHGRVRPPPRARRSTSGTAVMVGDQPGTDGLLAERLGIPFVLVDSGVTPPGAPVDGCPVALRAADFVVRGGHAPTRLNASRVLAECLLPASTPGTLGRMATNDSFQRYIDAGIAFTNMTRKKAEELVSELVKNGDIQTDEARARVDELLERGRQGTEIIVSAVRTEVSRQLGAVGITSLEDLANQVAALARTIRARRRRRPQPRRRRPRRPPPRRLRPRRPQPRRLRPRRRPPRRPRPRRRQPRRPRPPGPPPPGRPTDVLPPASASTGRWSHAKLADSRPQAVELIARGVVLVSGSIADKPARLVSPAEPIELLGDPPPLRQPRGREAARRPRPVRPRPVRTAGPSTPEPPPEGSPTASSRPAPPMWWRSTSGTGSSIPACATTRRSPISSGSTSARSPSDTVGGPTRRLGGGRPVVHLGHPGRSRS